jgi:hypothetical protein
MNDQGDYLHFIVWSPIFAPHSIESDTLDESANESGVSEATVISSIGHRDTAAHAVGSLEYDAD